MPSLVEAVKQLREKQTQVKEVLIQKVEWDLDPRFIGEPMVPRVLKALSHYVDTRLLDYSSIQGSVPATNLPIVQIEYDAPEYPTKMQALNPTYTQPQGTMLARESLRQGVIIDNPNLFDPEWITRWNIPEPIDEDEHVCAEMTDEVSENHNPDGINCNEIIPNITICNDPGVTIIDGVEEIHAHQLNVTKEGLEIINHNPLRTDIPGLPGASLRDFVSQTAGIGTQVNAPYGHVPGPEDDIQVFAGGCLPEARRRYKDSFIREHDKHQVFRMTHEQMGTEKNISYVASYTIEHATQKIKARVITAPPSFKMENDLWFELCTNDGKNSYDLKEIIRNTVQANLCIFIPSRVSLPKNVKGAEKTALETLRDMISEQEFRNYIRYGFLTVKSTSGLIYQIFRDHPHTKIWEKGKVVEEVCVRLKMDGVPPTDNIIAFKIMIETNEAMFKSLGNVYNMRKKVA